MCTEMERSLAAFSTGPRTHSTNWPLLSAFAVRVSTDQECRRSLGDRPLFFNFARRASSGHTCRRSLGDRRREWHRVRSMYELRDLRRATGLGQREFAALLCVPLETFRTWDSGRRAVPALVLQRARSAVAQHTRLNEGLPLDQLARELHVHLRTLQAAVRTGNCLRWTRWLTSSPFIRAHCEQRRVTVGSPPPSAPRAGGSPRARLDDRTAPWRTSTCARSAVDATAEWCRA
jgi:hypothetical protein